MGKPKQRVVFTKAFVFFMAALVVMVLFSRTVWIQRIRYPIAYTELITRYSEEYSLDPHLVSAVIWVESRFQSDAVSRRDARGLMQVTPGTGSWGAEWIGIEGYDDEQLFDPEINIRIGSWYLKNLSNQFNYDPLSRNLEDPSLTLVLAAYNGGSGNVTRWLENEEYSQDGKTLDYIPFPETRSYVDKVLEAYTVHREIYPLLGK